MDRNIDLLRIAYLVGGVYDLVLAIALFAYSITFPLFNLTIPEDKLFIFTIAYFLIGVGFLLVYTAGNAVNYIIIGLVSAIVRIAFGITVYLMVVIEATDTNFIIFATTDILTGLFLLIPALPHLKQS